MRLSNPSQTWDQTLDLASESLHPLPHHRAFSFRFLPCSCPMVRPVMPGRGFRCLLCFLSLESWPGISPTGTALVTALFFPVLGKEQTTGRVYKTLLIS
jgi:hypothetical protein